MSDRGPVDQAIEYYNKRASIMDNIYAQGQPAWVREMIDDLQRALRGRRVLEVACGTGHWTRYAAQVAEHVTGLDAAPNMLAVARTKGMPTERVALCLGDAFVLTDVSGDFNAGLAMQWFSHVPRARLAEFLVGWHDRIGAGAVVFMGDNQRWEGMIDRTYAKYGETDTYETRWLPDRSSYEIVKNYFTPDELRATLAPYAEDLVVICGRYWWWLSYTVASQWGARTKYQ